MIHTHATTVIDEKLDISYEPAHEWVSDDGKHGETEPETAVLLVTRCCTVNHDHISLNKEQAEVLAKWLTAFANGEYDE